MVVMDLSIYRRFYFAALLCSLAHSPAHAEVVSGSARIILWKHDIAVDPALQIYVQLLVDHGMHSIDAVDKAIG